MSSRHYRFRLWCLTIFLVIYSAACGKANASMETPDGNNIDGPTYSSLPSDLPQVIQATAFPSATSTTLPMPVERVVVFADSGNIFIRRGPNLAFNPLSVLRAGQSAPALARDVLAGWVQIRLPDQPDRTGWISIQSHYTFVSGTVMGLPVIEPTDWPVQASLRNCTYHQMVIEPGGIVLPSVDNFPENEVPVNPGMYVVRDTDVDSYPEVMTVDVGEGSTIEVRVDGNGERRKCR